MDADKFCKKCQTRKEMSAFGKDKHRPGGVALSCKDCTNAASREQHRGNPLTLKRYRDRNKDETYRAFQKARHQTEKAKKEKLERTRSYREMNPEKYKAHMTVGYAVKTGNLIKQPCEVCGELKVVAHHDDYSKPLCVRWLCHSHHNLVHSSYG